MEISTKATPEIFTREEEITVKVLREAFNIETQAVFTTKTQEIFNSKAIIQVNGNSKQSLIEYVIIRNVGTKQLSKQMPMKRVIFYWKWKIVIAISYLLLQLFTFELSIS